MSLFRKRKGPSAEDQARQQLTLWLASQPNAGEFELRTLFAGANMHWPVSRQDEEVFLVNITRDGREEIAFAGPTAYCFFDIDYSGYTEAELWALYAGWHACFSLLQNPHTEIGNLVGETAEIAVQLREAGYSNLELTEAVHIGGTVQCTFKLEHEGQAKIWVGDVHYGELHAADAPVMQRPLYWYLGKNLLGSGNELA